MVDAAGLCLEGCRLVATDSDGDIRRACDEHAEEDLVLGNDGWGVVGEIVLEWSSACCAARGTRL